MTKIEVSYVVVLSALSLVNLLSAINKWKSKNEIKGVLKMGMNNRAMFKQYSVKEKNQVYWNKIFMVIRYRIE